MYQIEGRATAPPTIDCVWSCKAMTVLDKTIRITPVNPIREKAVNFVLQAKSSKQLKSNAKNLQQSVDREIYQLPKKPLKYKVFTHILETF